MTRQTLVRPPFRLLTLVAFGLFFGSNLLMSSPGYGAALQEMTELISHPEHYHRQEVVVMGKVTNLEAVVDRDGHPAFKFLLEGGSGILKVMTRTEVQDGEHVIVEGVFSRRRQSGRLTVYNEVNAVSVRPLNRLDPDLVG